MDRQGFLKQAGIIGITLDPKTVEAFRKLQEKIDRLPTRFQIIEADYQEIITTDSRLLKQGAYEPSELS